MAADTPPLHQPPLRSKLNPASSYSRKKTGGIGPQEVEKDTFPASLPPLTVGQLEDLVHQLLMYLGYLALNCAENQSFATTGPPPTLLVRLCTFPILYFSDDR